MGSTPDSRADSRAGGSRTERGEHPGAGVAIDLAVAGADDATRSVHAYVSEPAAGHGVGLLVLHDEDGFGDHVRGVCDRLARAGFVALAPELFARGEAAALDTDATGRVLEASMIELHNRHATDGARVGVLGFGAAGLAGLAARSPRVGAVADFYGPGSDPEAARPEWASLQAPLLVVFAGEGGLSEPARRTFEAAIGRAGVRSSLQTRADVPRGYMNDARPDVHDAVAAAEGWDLLLAFFRAELP